MTAASQTQQMAGSVTTSSRATNGVQGAIQNTSVSTDMAINGSGYFVVAQPQSSSDNQPVFSGTDLFTRRGDFQENENGYLVNGAGYYLMGIPVDPTTGNPVGSVPQVLQFNNNLMPASATTTIDYQANLPAFPQTTNANASSPGSELLNPADYTANPLAGAPVPAKITGNGANLSPDAPATETGTVNLGALSATAGTLVINGTNITVNAGDSASAVVNDINGQTSATGVTASLNSSNNLVLAGADASTNTDIGSGSTAANLTQLGLSVGTSAATNLNNVSVGGVALGNVQLKFGTSGLTQFSDSSGTIQVNALERNGFAAGQLQSIAVDNQNRVVGSFSNGQTIPLAEIRGRGVRSRRRGGGLAGQRIAVAEYGIDEHVQSRRL